MLKQHAFLSSNLPKFLTAACFSTKTAVFLIWRQSIVVQTFTFFPTYTFIIHVLPNGLFRITEKPFRQCGRGFITARNRLSGNAKRAFPQSVNRKNASHKAL